MKHSYLFFLLILIGFLACKKEQSKVEENAAVKNQSYQEKKKEESTTTALEYTFDMYSALGYKLGDPAEKNRYPKQHMLKRGADKYMDEGETWKVPKTMVSDEDGVLIDLVHDQDKRMGGYVPFIAEIVVHSNKLKNAEGIGVGSTLKEFTNAYPYSYIYYSYIQDKIWVENAADGYLFYFDLPEHLHKKIDVTSEVIEVPFSLVDENSKIKYIRIFGFKTDGGNVTSFVGSWKGIDSHSSEIAVKIYEKNGSVFADIKTGEEVYQQFTEQLIQKDNLYISKPTSERKVMIDIVKVNPRQLSVFLDDNQEFDPISATLSAVRGQTAEKVFSQNISSACHVLNFTQERGRVFVNVQLIDFVENDSNGFDVFEGDKRTFELVQEEFMSCRERMLSIKEIWSRWEQLKGQDMPHYHITVTNGLVTAFYFQDCAG